MESRGRSDDSQDHVGKMIVYDGSYYIQSPEQKQAAAEHGEEMPQR
jgi:hypothetical protein